MFQFNQIRELFLANARKHLLAFDKTVAPLRGAFDPNSLGFLAGGNGVCIGKAKD